MLNIRHSRITETGQLLNPSAVNNIDLDINQN
jgi:hypothetical protein